jgi:hypothetical protein
MPGGSHPPSQATAWHHRAQCRRRAADRDLSAKAGIRQMGSRQGRKPAPKLLVSMEVLKSYSCAFAWSPDLSTSSGRPCRGGEKTSRVIQLSSLVTAPWGTSGGMT